MPSSRARTNLELTSRSTVAEGGRRTLSRPADAAAAARRSARRRCWPTPPNPSPSEVASGVPSPSRPATTVDDAERDRRSRPRRPRPHRPPHRAFRPAHRRRGYPPPRPDRTRCRTRASKTACSCLERGHGSERPKRSRQPTPANPHSGKASARIDIIDPGLDPGVDLAPTAGPVDPGRGLLPGQGRASGLGGARCRHPDRLAGRSIAARNRPRMSRTISPELDRGDLPDDVDHPQ